jgi:CRISPR-associated protein Cas2
MNLNNFYAATGSKHMTHTPAQTKPQSHAQRWLLAYDISNPKRLQAVCRYLRKEGVPLQYSVYLLAATRGQLAQVMEKLRQLMDEREDDVRIYPINESTRIWGLGTQFDSDGNTLTDAFIDKLVQTKTSEPSKEAQREELKF